MEVHRGESIAFEINPDDNSTQVKRVMGDNVLNITCRSVAPLTFQIGDRVNFQGEWYTLNRLPTGKQVNTRHYEYTLQFQGIEYELTKVLYKLIDNTPTPARCDFSLMGNAEVFAQLLVDNLNAFDSGWTVGEVVESTYRTITFTNEDCMSVLARLAQEFDTEYWVTPSKVVNLTTRELPVEAPVLQYGRGNGLKEVIKAHRDDSNIITRLYAYGAERNIQVEYREGARRLLLPGNDPFIEENTELYGVIEAVITFDDIYPRLDAGLGENEPGKVTAVDGLLKFRDANLDFDVNDQLLTGIKAKVVFNTGQLAGQEFEISNYFHANREFTIIPNNFEDAGELPVSGIQAAIGDEYVLIDVEMPEAYVTRAEQELLARATEHLARNSHPRDTLTVTTDVLYLRDQDMHFDVGQMVHINASPVGIDREIRVVGFTRKIREIFDYRIELADTINIGRLDRVEAGVENAEKRITVNSDRDRMYTRRTYRDVQGTIDMMFDPEGEFFQENITPLVVQTAQLLVGTNSQQFAFMHTIFRPNFQGDPNDFRWTSGQLVHIALEREWNFVSGQLPTLTAATPYYIYAQCDKDGAAGTIIRSTAKILVDEDPDNYHFLIGILNAVDEDHRSFQPTYGFTEITGQFITTGVIKSSDGETYFDLNEGEIGGRIVFSNGTKTLEELGSQFDETQDYIDNVLPGIIDDIHNQLDGVIEQWFDDYDPTNLNEPAASWIIAETEEEHLGDLFYNIDTGKVFRWVKDGSTYFWQELQDSEVAQALATANQALNLAGSKRRVFVAQPVTPYDVGDLWVQGAAGDIMQCQTARASGSFQAGDWVKASKYTDDETVNTLINNLGDLAYDDLVELAKLGETVIEGGYLKTSLIDVAMLIVQGSLETEAGSTSKFNTAFNAANTAQSTANNAISIATNAEGFAAQAISLLSDIASDNRLTPDEKQATKKEWDIIVSEKAKIDSSANAYNVSRTAYNNAFNSLDTYITPLLDNLTTTSTIVGSTFRTNFKNYYDARQDILNAIAAKAKDLADTAQTTVNNLINNLGTLAYDDIVEIAKLGNTIIQGGFIKTTLIDVNTLIAKHVLTAASGRRVHVDGNNNRIRLYTTTGTMVLTIEDNIAADGEGNSLGGIRMPNIFQTGLQTQISGLGVRSTGSDVSGPSFEDMFSSSNSVWGSVVASLHKMTPGADYHGAIIGVDKTPSSFPNNFGGLFNSIYTGSLHYPARLIGTSSNITLNAWDHFIVFAQLNAITAYLPLNPKPGRHIRIKRVGNGNVTINGNGKLIRHTTTAGVSSVSISQGSQAELIYVGGVWYYSRYGT